MPTQRRVSPIPARALQPWPPCAVSLLSSHLHLFFKSALSIFLNLIFSDFPGGEGESHFLNRGGREHVQGGEAGLRALGLEKFGISEGASEGEAQAILEANKVLFAEASG